MKESTLKFVPGAAKVYGIKMPVLNDLAKRYKEVGFDIVELLWEGEYYEERMLSAKILGHIARTNPDKTLKIVRSFAKEISDWAICDCIGMQSVKKILKLRQSEIFKLSDSMFRSKSLWQRRLSLVLLQGFTKQKELRREIKIRIDRLREDDEYYVKKAIQWLDRDLEKHR